MGGGARRLAELPDRHRGLRRGARRVVAPESTVDGQVVGGAGRLFKDPAASGDTGIEEPVPGGAFLQPALPVVGAAVRSNSKKGRRCLTPAAFRGKMAVWSFAGQKDDYPKEARLGKTSPVRLHPIRVFFWMEVLSYGDGKVT